MSARRAAVSLLSSLDRLLASGALYDDDSDPRVTAAIRDAMRAAREARNARPVWVRDAAFALAGMVVAFALVWAAWLNH